MAPFPKTYIARQITANLSEEAAPRAQRLCEHLQITRAELVRRAVDAFCEAHPEVPKDQQEHAS